MVYNNLKDKVKSFLKPFAESGEAVSAEHIKAYFEKLRGDDQAMKEMTAAAPITNRNGDGDNRREQGGKQPSNPDPTFITDLISRLLNHINTIPNILIYTPSISHLPHPSLTAPLPAYPAIPPPQP